MALLNSYMWKIGLGKGLGFGYGLVWFFMLPLAIPDLDPLLRWGILGWAITMGALAAVIVLARPNFGLPFSKVPNWLISGAMGAWMGALLILLAYDIVAQFTAAFRPASLQSPWFIIVETALLGIIIGWATAHLFEKPAKGHRTD